MNQKLKNVFSFIKEALELKNKNIYNLNDYEIHYDFGKFYNQFKELIDIPDYCSLNINSTGVIFKIKYMKEDKKKDIPSVPKFLGDYFFSSDFFFFLMPKRSRMPSKSFFMIIPSPCVFNDDLVK